MSLHLDAQVFRQNGLHHMRGECTHVASCEDGLVKVDEALELDIPVLTTASALPRGATGERRHGPDVRLAKIDVDSIAPPELKFLEADVDCPFVRRTVVSANHRAGLK